jgi:hypothetical protein
MGVSEKRKQVIVREPICPERIRSIDGQGFAFIPNRFLREGFFASLTADELRLYVLLVLAGDRRGLSFYHYDSICSLLEVTLDDYIAARNGLIEKDLIAYDGSRFQVLALPPHPAPRVRRAASDDPDAGSGDSARAEIRRAILASLRGSTD